MEELTCDKCGVLFGYGDGDLNCIDFLCVKCCKEKIIQVRHKYSGQLATVSLCDWKPEVIGGETVWERLDG